MADLGKEIGWDDAIENEGTEFEPLPEGVYEFTVVSMERAHFGGKREDGALQHGEPGSSDQGQGRQ